MVVLFSYFLKYIIYYFRHGITSSLFWGPCFRSLAAIAVGSFSFVFIADFCSFTTAFAVLFFCLDHHCSLSSVCYQLQLPLARVWKPSTAVFSLVIIPLELSPQDRLEPRRHSPCTRSHTPPASTPLIGACKPHVTFQWFFVFTH